MRGVLRAIGILIGTAVALYGIALYALRCFDTCPSDPAEDASLQLLSGAVILFGVALVVFSATFATRRSRAASRILTTLGTVIAGAGVVSLLLVPYLDTPGDRTGWVLMSVAALIVGAGIAMGSIIGRRRRITFEPDLH